MEVPLAQAIVTLVPGDADGTPYQISTVEFVALRPTNVQATFVCVTVDTVVAPRAAKMPIKTLPTVGVVTVTVLVVEIALLLTRAIAI